MRLLQLLQPLSTELSSNYSHWPAMQSVLHGTTQHLSCFCLCHCLAIAALDNEAIDPWIRRGTAQCS